MEPFTFGILAVVIFLVLIFMGQRIAIAGAVAGLFALLGVFGWEGALILIRGHILSVTTRYGFTVVPMFLFMGLISFHAGLGDHIYAAAQRWVGRLHGGLAMATTLGCAVFGAITGSSTSAAIMFAKLAVPEMDKYNYDRGLSVGAVAASGTLATLIPPSVSIVIYGIITEQSIGKLLIAGLIPGIVSALVYCLMIYVRARINPKLGPRGPAFSWRERFSSMKTLWPVMAIMIMVLGGLYVGVFTPTEAGAMGVFSTLVVVALRRRLNWTMFKGSVLETARLTSMAFLIIVGVQILMTSLVTTGITGWLVESLMSVSTSPYLVLLMIIILFVVFGCFIGGIGMMLTTIPFVYPIVIAAGFDPIWFGIIVTKMVEIALITPPVGANVFVVAKVLNYPVEKAFKSVIPFFFMDLATTGLLILFPQIVLWLPNNM
ncbi:TRAP transporter large permease [Chloroflexota bacterium]